MLREERVQKDGSTLVKTLVTPDAAIDAPMREAATAGRAVARGHWRSAKVTLPLAVAAWFAITAAPAAAGSPSAAASPSAKDMLQHAFAAMGERGFLSSLHSLKLELRVVDYRIDDSERTDGPYWLNVGIGTRWVDLDHERSRTEWDQASAQWPLQIVRIEQRDIEAVGGRWQGKWQWTEARGPIYSSVALQPETILATAADAADLHGLPDQIVHDQWQHVLAFTYEGHPVRLYVDRLLYLPSRLEITGARSGTPLAAMLGDVEWGEDYLFYKRLPDGLVMPYQRNVSRNGQAYETTVVTALQENASARTEVTRHRSALARALPLCGAASRSIRSRCRSWPGASGSSADPGMSWSFASPMG